MGYAPRDVAFPGSGTAPLNAAISALASPPLSAADSAATTVRPLEMAQSVSPPTSQAWQAALAAGWPASGGRPDAPQTLNPAPDALQRLVAAAAAEPQGFATSPPTLPSTASGGSGTDVASVIAADPSMAAGAASPQLPASSQQQVSEAPTGADVPPGGAANVTPEPLHGLDASSTR